VAGGWWSADTSAALKLVATEAETRALTVWIEAHADAVVSSDLLRSELLRVTRGGAPDKVVQARMLLDSITLLTVSTAIFERAATLDPTLLRSLDALHLAAAMELGDELEGIITYDIRLADAATEHGFAVVAPS
jgi:uncharacterized protein